MPTHKVFFSPAAEKQLDALENSTVNILGIFYGGQSYESWLTEHV